MAPRPANIARCQVNTLSAHPDQRPAAPPDGVLGIKLEAGPPNRLLGTGPDSVAGRDPFEPGPRSPTPEQFVADSLEKWGLEQLLPT
jgi:hypothetical protein